jgi:hypothetical protein
VKTLDLLKGEEFNVVKLEIMEFIKKFIIRIIRDIESIFEKKYPEKGEISKEEKVKIHLEILIQNY